MAKKKVYRRSKAAARNPASSKLPKSVASLGDGWAIMVFLHRAGPTTKAGLGKALGPWEGSGKPTKAQRVGWALPDAAAAGMVIRDGNRYRKTTNEEQFQIESGQMGATLRRSRNPKPRKPRSIRTVRNRGPAVKRAVPASIAKTPRSRATRVYALPKNRSYPIGDLYHARLALIYAMSPTNSKNRRKVIQAVKARWPQYDWARWWNKERKGKRGLRTWGFYVRKAAVAKHQKSRRNP